MGVIDSLYDFCSLNLINKKIPLKFLKSLLRLVVQLAKTIFRSIAFYWVKNNTPELITNWLIGKIMISTKPKKRPMKSNKKLAKNAQQKKVQKKKKVKSNKHSKRTKSSAKVVQYFAKLSEAQKLEIEQKKNVMLLVENMMKREEATFKMVIDSLYDVGSLNLINKKNPLKFLKSLLRLVVKLAKTIFHSIA